MKNLTKILIVTFAMGIAAGFAGLTFFAIEEDGFLRAIFGAMVIGLVSFSLTAVVLRMIVE